MWQQSIALLRRWLTPKNVRPARKATRLAVELLEDRVTLSAGLREQYMLELINRMRENPAAELPILLNSGDPDVNAALSYFNVNRSVLATQWSSLTPAPALAWNDSLATAALGHDVAMLTAGLQSHQVPGEPDLATRIVNVGYANWSTLGENVFAYASSVFEAHAAFAIDWGSTSTGIQNPPGHRLNLMDSSFRDVGIGLLDNPTNVNSVGPLLVTQDFGNRFSYGSAFVVGTVFNDANANRYYDQGEGLAGVTLTVSGAGATVTTTAYGGYQIQLAPGVHTITASGGSLPAPVVRSVTVGSANVHLNFIQGALPHEDASLPFADDFGRSDSSFIGAYWTPVQGNFSVIGNQVTATDAGRTIAVVNGISVTDVAVQADLSIGAGQGAGLIARYQTDGRYFLGMLQADAAGFTPYLFRFVPGIGFTQIAVGATIAEGPGTLRLEAIGTSLKLYFGPDGDHLSLAAYGQDSSLAGGTAGLRAVQGVRIDNFALTAISVTSAALPFSDAFAQPDGSQLTLNWSERKGNFGVVSGTLRANDAAPSLATLNSAAVADVAVQADVAIGAGRGAGLIARYQSDGRFYLGMLQADAGGTSFSAYFFVYSSAAGFVQIGAAPVIAAGPGTLRFEMVGASLKLYFGPDAGRLNLVHYTYDTALAAAGRTGIRATQGVTLDNLAVTGFAPTSPAALPFTDAFTPSSGGQLSRNWTGRQGNFSSTSGAATGNDPLAPSIATLNGVTPADAAVQAYVAVGPAGSGAGLIARNQSNGNYYLGMLYADGTGVTPYLFKYVAGVGFTLLAAGPRLASGAGTLRFVLAGSSLRLYFGADADSLALCASANDASITSPGLTGIRATTGASLDNFNVS